jgi:hypothetical protein
MAYVACLRVWDLPYSEMYHSQVLVRYFNFVLVVVQFFKEMWLKRQNVGGYFIQETVRKNLNVILCETSDNLELNVTERYNIRASLRT